MTIQQEVHKLLSGFNVPQSTFTSGSLTVTSPITGEVIAKVATTSAPDDVIASAHRAFLGWRNLPAPRRGELVRLLGDELRAERVPLGRLVTLEAGKILSEGL